MYNVTLWCVRLMFILPIYLNSLMPFKSKGALSRSFDITTNNNTYLGFHVQRPIFSSDFNQIWSSTTYIHKGPSPQYHISWTHIQWEPQWYLRTDGQKTDG